jgi:hypothetical protein
MTSCVGWSTSARWVRLPIPAWMKPFISCDQGSSRMASGSWRTRTRVEFTLNSRMATTNRVAGIRCARVVFSGGTKSPLPEPGRVEAGGQLPGSRHRNCGGGPGVGVRMGCAKGVCRYESGSVLTSLRKNQKRTHKTKVISGILVRMCKRDARSEQDLGLQEGTLR